MPYPVTRRNIALGFASLLPAVVIKPNAIALTASFADDSGISHACERIHQELVIKASPMRVYQALTDEKQFREVTNFSIPGAATSISPEVGGTFTIFGDVISGRHIEMVPGERLVQAWREKDWEPGVYSVVKFQLTAKGPDTRLVFDHTGFPAGHAESLAKGWKSHYWLGLQRFLS